MQRLKLAHFFPEPLQVFRALPGRRIFHRASLLLWVALCLIHIPNARARQADFDPCAPLPVLLSLNAEFSPAGQVEQTPTIPIEFQNLKATVNVRSDSREITKETYRLHGHVEVTYLQFKLDADDAIYNRSSNEVIATGH